jgi:hypothetical protein
VKPVSPQDPIRDYVLVVENNLLRARAADKACVGIDDFAKVSLSAIKQDAPGIVHNGTVAGGGQHNSGVPRLIIYPDIGRS